MKLREHETLLATLNNAFQKLAKAKGPDTQKNKLSGSENVKRLESEWQESLEAYNDFFREYIEPQGLN
jgi:hypothetical protein